MNKSLFFLVAITTFTFFSLMFSCQKKDIVEPECEGDMDSGLIEILPETTEKIPYSSPFYSIKFKNAQNDSIELRSTSNSWIIQEYGYGSSYSCSLGETFYHEYKTKELNLVYRSPTSPYLHLAVTPRVIRLADRGSEFWVYDKLSLRIAKYGHSHDGTLVPLVNNLMNIPVSFHGNIPSDVVKQFNLDIKPTPELSIGDKVYQNVFVYYEGNKKLIVFSFETGLISFIDDIGQEWFLSQ